MIQRILYALRPKADFAEIMANVIDKGLMYIHNRLEWLTKMTSQIIATAIESR